MHQTHPDVMYHPLVAKTNNSFNKKPSKGKNIIGKVKAKVNSIR